MRSSFMFDAYSGNSALISSIDTTLPALTKSFASAPLKKNRTSGSEPVSKSVMILVLKVSSEVAEVSLTVFPVAASQSATAFL